MISTSNIETAKKEIKKSKKPIIVKAQNDQFNRKILEYGKFQILLSPESGERKNKLRQIDSGFNHVLGKIASKNKVAIGIDVKEIKELSKEEKGKRMAKIKQNIDICKKTNTKIKIIPNKSKKECFHFLISLGASTSQAKEATKSF
jgi:RNase P/RNase MRP subunit p30